MKTGTCLCGKVSIEIKDFHSEVGACHCSMCRKWSSGPLMTVEGGTSENITINNEHLVTKYQSSEWAERGFCSCCGSKLFYHLLPMDTYNIPIGLFEDQEGADLSLEIYYDQKPKYYSFANETNKLTKADLMKMVQENFHGEAD